MSSKTRRWFCRECKREWLDPKWANLDGGMYANSSPITISGNPPGLNCPTCGSPEIELIKFTPPYPGLDIPREGESETQIIPTEMITRIPGLTGHQEEITTLARPDLVVSSSPTPIIEVDSIPPPTVIQEEIEKNHERGSIYDLSDMD